MLKVSPPEKGPLQAGRSMDLSQAGHNCHATNENDIPARREQMSDFTDMEIFARVVGAGSMSAAGREMGLSPAVISKRLKRLEDRLGTRLLQRTTRQIALTEAGATSRRTSAASSIATPRSR
jgi:hypothetical protein